MSHGFRIYNVILMKNLPKLGSKHHWNIKNGLSSQKSYVDNHSRKFEQK